MRNARGTIDRAVGCPRHHARHHGKVRIARVRGLGQCGEHVFAQRRCARGRRAAQETHLHVLTGNLLQRRFDVIDTGIGEDATAQCRSRRLRQSVRGVTAAEHRRDARGARLTDLSRHLADFRSSRFVLWIRREARHRCAERTGGHRTGGLEAADSPIVVLHREAISLHCLERIGELVDGVVGARRGAWPPGYARSAIGRGVFSAPTKPGITAGRFSSSWPPPSSLSAYPRRPGRDSCSPGRWRSHAGLFVAAERDDQIARRHEPRASGRMPSGS